MASCRTQRKNSLNRPPENSVPTVYIASEDQVHFISMKRFRPMEAQEFLHEEICNIMLDKYFVFTSEWHRFFFLI